MSTLRSEMADMLDGAETILKTRIDQFGVASPEISKDKAQGHIYMELAGVDNPDRIQKLIEQSADLDSTMSSSLENALAMNGPSSAFYNQLMKPLRRSLHKSSMLLPMIALSLSL